jgi:HSP20 family protein
MATRSLWNPASELMSLREAMDRLVSDSFISPRTLFSTMGGGAVLPANLFEHGEGFIVQVALPGADPEKVQVTAQGEVVTIKGERVAPQFEGAQQIWNGIGYGPFEQSFSLPTAVDPSGAQAGYEHGILTLRLPKAQHARAHTIKINGGSQKVLEANGTSK